MPKQLVEIRDFNYGIMSSPSETDIPLQAAVYSLNVDPTIEDGKLGGVPQDTTEIASFPAAQMQWVEETGGGKERTLFYHDPSTDSFNYYRDYFGSPLGPFTIPESVTPDSELIAPIQQGHSLHIGMGNSQPAKWVGYVQHKQFNVAPPTDLVMYDATLDQKTLPVNGVYKTAQAGGAGSHLLAIGYGGTSIMLITTATGVVSDSSDTDGITFRHLQAMCESSAGAGYVWVYDNDDTAYGTLYEVLYNAGVWSITKTCPITSWADYGLEDPSSMTCTDLIQGGGTDKDVWFAIHSLSGGVKIVGKRSGDPTDIHPMGEDLSGGYATLLFRTNGIPSSGSISTINMSPSLDGTDESQAHIGKFRLENQVDSGYHYFNLVTFMKPLIKLSSTSDDIGYFCTFKTGTSTPKINTPSVDGGAWKYIGLAMYMIDSDMVAGSDAYPNGMDEVDIRFVKLSGTEEGDNGITSFYDLPIKSFQAALVDDGAAVTRVVLSIGTSSGTSLHSFDDDKFVFSASDNFPMIYLEDGAGNQNQIDSLGVGVAGATLSLNKQTSSTLYITIEQGGFSLSSTQLATGGTFGAVTYIKSGDFTFIPRDTHVNADGMRRDRSYRYFMALEYDGYQIGPLSALMVSHRPSEDGKAIYIDVYFKDTEIPNPRVSGVYILRSYMDGLVSTQEDSLPRVIGKIDLTTMTETKMIPGFSDTYYFFTVKDTNAPAETFEELAGYSHTATNCSPYYGLACSGGGQLFVADCGNIDGIEDASNYGFFSEISRYDQFNLLDNFVVFSEKPNAIAYHRGRFFAFASAKFWRINPSGPLIEDEFDGIGCEGRDCVFANEYGLFVAGTSNIYIETGNGFQAIGDPILKSSNGVSGYQERTTTDAPLVLFDMKRKSFLVFFTDGSGNPRCYAFNIERRRWDLWEAPSGVCAGLIGEDGKMLISNAQSLYSYLGSTSKRTYSWWSKVMDAGMNTIDKKWYKVRVPFEGIANQNLVTCKDYSASSVSVTDASESGMIVKEMSDIRKRGLQVCIDGMNGTAVIDSIGVIYRPFVGVR